MLTAGFLQWTLAVTGLVERCNELMNFVLFNPCFVNFITYEHFVRCNTLNWIFYGK